MDYIVDHVILMPPEITSQLASDATSSQITLGVFIWYDYFNTKEVEITFMATWLPYNTACEFTIECVINFLHYRTAPELNQCCTLSRIAEICYCHTIKLQLYIAIIYFRRHFRPLVQIHNYHKKEQFSMS